MARSENVVWCDGCGVEITWAPLIDQQRDYCCEECYQGLPCHCAERLEVEEERGRGQSEPAY